MVGLGLCICCAGIAQEAEDKVKDAITNFGIEHMQTEPNRKELSDRMTQLKKAVMALEDTMVKEYKELKQDAKPGFVTKYTTAYNTYRNKFSIDKLPSIAELLTWLVYKVKYDIAQALDKASTLTDIKKRINARFDIADIDRFMLLTIAGFFTSQIPEIDSQLKVDIALKNFEKIQEAVRQYVLRGWETYAGLEKGTQLVTEYLNADKKLVEESKKDKNAEAQRLAYLLVFNADEILLEALNIKDATAATKAINDKMEDLINIWSVIIESKLSGENILQSAIKNFVAAYLTVNSEETGKKAKELLDKAIFAIRQSALKQFKASKISDLGKADAGKNKKKIAQDFLTADEQEFAAKKIDEMALLTKKLQHAESFALAEAMIGGDVGIIGKELEKVKADYNNKIDQKVGKKTTTTTTDTTTPPTTTTDTAINNLAGALKELTVKPVGGKSEETSGQLLFKIREWVGSLAIAESAPSLRKEDKGEIEKLQKDLKNALAEAAKRPELVTLLKGLPAEADKLIQEAITKKVSQENFDQLAADVRALQQMAELNNTFFTVADTNKLLTKIEAQREIAPTTSSTAVSSIFGSNYWKTGWWFQKK